VTVRLMSDGELTRLEVLRDLDQRRLTTEAAARLLRLERRQVFRLLKAYRTGGPAGLISKRRGRRSNRRKPEALRNAALAIIREWYWDFGPTLAAEKLREVHGITRDHRRVTPGAAGFRRLVQYPLAGRPPWPQDACSDQGRPATGHGSSRMNDAAACLTTLVQYSDKHGVFRVNQRGALGDGMTQFGRALHALNVDILRQYEPSERQLAR
jgi:winged helix-turn helix protein